MKGFPISPWQRNRKRFTQDMVEKGTMENVVKEHGKTLEIVIDKINICILLKPALPGETRNLRFLQLVNHQNVHAQPGQEMWFFVRSFCV